MSKKRQRKEEEIPLDNDNHNSSPTAPWCSSCRDSLFKGLPCQTADIAAYEIDSKKLPPCSRTICVGPPGSGACIELHNVQQIIQNISSYLLVCPSCWHTATKGDKKCAPYYPLYYSQNKQKVEPNPVAMVNQRTIPFFPHLYLHNTLLVDISHPDFAAYRVAFQGIKVSLDEFAGMGRILQYKNISLGIQERSYTSSVQNIIQTIQNCKIHQVIILITTHCEEDGTLCWLGNQYLEAGKFFQQVFPKSLRASLGATSAHLLLMCCPGLFKSEQAYGQYIELAHTKTFSSIVGFPNETALKPYLLRHFASAWYERIIRDGGSYSRTLSSICDLVPELGVHASILAAYWDHTDTFHVQKYIWCHKFRAPFGIQFQQALCPDCLSFNCLSFKRDLAMKKVIVTCSHAKWQKCKTRTISVDGVYLISPQGNAESRGEWFTYSYTWGQFDSNFRGTYDSL